MDTKKPELKDFDDMLKIVGSWGRFQILATCFFFPFNLSLAYVFLSSILINFTPSHWCKVEALMDLPMELRRNLSIPIDEITNLPSKCQVYDTDWTQVLARNISEADPSWTKVDCSSGWEYDIHHFHRSIVVDFDWVCGDAWIPSLSQALFFAGAIPGTMFFGLVSDKYGRVPATMISNIVGMISGLVTPFVTGYWSYFFLRFMMGFGFNSCFIVPYMLTLEYVDESKRTLVGNLGLALILTLGGVYQPWLIKWLGDWKLFSWAIFGQMVFVFAMPWVMPESSRWLMSQGKTEKAVKVMRHIARVNKKEVPEETFESFKKLCEIQNEELKNKKTLSVFDLFLHNKNQCKNTVLIIILFMTIALVFDASVRNVENLHFSIYISFMVSTALELPADLLSIVGIEKVGRRWSASISLALVGICMLVTIPAQEYGYITVAAFTSMSGRFFATYAMNTGFQFTIEVMPTELRGQGNALASLMSHFASIASPYIVFSSNLHPHLPFYLMACLGILGAIPGLFLPETAGIPLIDSLEESRTFGKKDNFFWMPLMGAERRYKNSQQESAEMKKTEEVTGASNPTFSNF